MTYDVPVSTGELLDKFSILAIKLAHITTGEKRVNILKEYNHLARIIEDAKILSSTKVQDAYFTLCRVNLDLWNVEDALRDMEANKKFDENFTTAARSVYRLNDERFRLKTVINKETNSGIVEEKSYKKY